MDPVKDDKPLGSTTVGGPKLADPVGEATEVEQPIVLAVPAVRSIRLRGRMRRIGAGRTDLALSESEWANWISE